MPIRNLTLSVIAALLLLGSAAPGRAAGLPKAAPRQASTAKPKAKAPAKAPAKKRSAARRPATRRERAQTAPTRDRIVEIQAALAKEGAYQGSPSGRWDEPSVEALRQFQQTHGLNPTGKINALALEKLGLGSETNGQGAPLPRRDPSASVLGSSNQQQP